MRAWCILFGAAALTACTSNTIDAGGNDAGAKRLPTSTDGGADSGPTAIASLIQLTPTSMASDGTSLYWVSTVSAGPVSSMSVEGGPIASIANGSAQGGFLTIDDANVYYLDNLANIERAPKSGGGAPALVNEPSDADSFIVLGTPAVLNGTAYWIERAGIENFPQPEVFALKSAVLKGGPVTMVATFTGQIGTGPNVLGVTSTTAFLSGVDQNGVYSFPLATGVPDGGAPMPVAGVSQPCGVLLSDTDAVYCEPDIAGSILRIASDGSVTVLGTILDSGSTGAGLTFDDTYVYWLDSLTVGTVNRVPKMGGMSTMLARDTNPVAIAVDANAVYWSDVGGNIMRLDK